MRILLAEDDLLLGEGLQDGLRQQGFQVDWVRDGDAADRELRSDAYAAAILDIGLPFKDGMDVLAAVRQSGEILPILVLTSRDAVSDKIKVLDLGADDYVIKPVDLYELGARLRALVRRSRSLPVESLSAQDVTLNPATRHVTRGGAAVPLSVREFDVLQTLMLNAGRILSREQLEQQVYSWGNEVGSNAIEVHMHHLRKKLGNSLIHTVRGVGYMIKRRRVDP